MARAPRRLTRAGFAEVAGEGILLAGGGRALLLQLADPAVAAGVALHSEFARDPLRRLLGTLEFVYVLGFGTEEEIRRVARSVGRAHRGVQGTDPVAYDARDPELQLWVAATLYDTSVQVWEAANGPLPDATADAVYRQSARFGTALGMPADAWPADRAAFRAYWEDRVSRLEVTPMARSVAGALMRPRRGPVWLRSAMPLVRVVTAGLLPESVRAGYGVRWDDRLQRQFEQRFGLLLGVYRMLPRVVRRSPSRVLLARFRAAGPHSTRD